MYITYLLYLPYHLIIEIKLFIEKKIFIQVGASQRSTVLSFMSDDALLI